jgi:hypothetical protein
MRRILMLILPLYTCLAGFSQEGSQLLNSFFSDQKYEIQKTGMLTSLKADLVLAKNIDVDNKERVTKAIVFTKDNMGIQVYLQIIGPVILDGYGTAISDISSIPSGFWGWNLRIAKREKDKAVFGFNLDALSGPAGENITNHPSIIWDISKAKFFVDTVDRSQF